MHKKIKVEMPRAYLYTNSGKIKKVNQDAAMVEIARDSTCGDIILAAVCDGMGGYSRGEVASSFVVNGLKDWFQGQLRQCLLRNMSFDEILKMLEKAVYVIDKRLKEYSDEKKIILGTTAVIYFRMGSQYGILNIGDSRGYLISRYRSRPLTHDQSLMQKKIDEGLISRKEARLSNERSIVLQGIGVSKNLRADVTKGIVQPGLEVMLCSDGFWRLIRDKEISLLTKTANIESNLVEMGKRLIDRGETDNLTALIIK